MGSDLYMDRQNWRSRPPRTYYVDENTFVIEKDSYYSGYYEVYRGPLDDVARGALLALGLDFPPDYKSIDNALAYQRQIAERAEGAGEKARQLYLKLAAMAHKARKEAEYLESLKV